MEVNNLKTFLAVAKYGSFKAGSGEFFLSPRAVSKQMDQLENELGVQLFLRNKNSSELTTEGKKFIVAAQDIVNTYNNELNRIQSEQLESNHRIRIGFASANQEIELQSLLLPVLKENKKVNIDFVQESGRRLVKLVAAGSLDIAISPFYDLTDPLVTKLGRVSLKRGELVVGVSKLSRLANKESISNNDLTDQNVFYYSPSDSDFMLDVFLNKFPDLFSKNQIKRCSSLELRDAYVAANKGIGFYPSPFIDIETVRNPLLNFIPLRETDNNHYSSNLFYDKNTKNKFLLRLVKQVRQNYS